MSRLLANAVYVKEFTYKTTVDVGITGIVLKPWLIQRTLGPSLAL
jgi:hypothetical protein